MIVPTQATPLAATPLGAGFLGMCAKGLQICVYAQYPRIRICRARVFLCLRIIACSTGLELGVLFIIRIIYCIMYYTYYVLSNPDRVEAGGRWLQGWSVGECVGGCDDEAGCAGAIVRQ